MTPKNEENDQKQSKAIVFEKCPRCYTKLDQRLTHCPVCGSGTIFDPTLSENLQPKPDIRIDQPERIIKLCQAFKDRYQDVERLKTDYFTRLRASSQRWVAGFGSIDPEKLVDDFFPNLVEATKWEPYENLDPITDITRGAFFAYFTLLREFAEFASSHPILDTEARESTFAMEKFQLAEQIKIHVAMSIDLLIEFERLYARSGNLSYTDYTFLERYHVNGMALALKLLDHHVGMVTSGAVKLDTSRAQKIVVALSVLQHACGLKDRTDIPADCLTEWRQFKELCDYYAGEIKFMNGLLEQEDWGHILHRYTLWSKPAWDDVMQMDEYSQAMYKVFNGLT